MFAKIIAFFLPKPVCEICGTPVADRVLPFCAAHESEYVSRTIW